MRHVEEQKTASQSGQEVIVGEVRSGRSALQASQRVSWSLLLAVSMEVSVRMASPGARSSLAKTPSWVTVEVDSEVVAASEGSWTARISSLGATSLMRSLSSSSLIRDNESRSHFIALPDVSCTASSLERTTEYTKRTANLDVADTVKVVAKHHEIQAGDGTTGRE